MNCANPTCKAVLSCGCKVRKASDGASCCTMCIAAYEAGLTAKRAQQPGANQAPTNVKVVYRGPGIQH